MSPLRKEGPLKKGTTESMQNSSERYLILADGVLYVKMSSSASELLEERSLKNVELWSNCRLDTISLNDYGDFGNFELEAVNEVEAIGWRIAFAQHIAYAGGALFDENANFSGRYGKDGIFLGRITENDDALNSSTEHVDQHVGFASGTVEPAGDDGAMSESSESYGEVQLDELDGSEFELHELEIRAEDIQTKSQLTEDATETDPHSELLYPEKDAFIVTSKATDITIDTDSGSSSSTGLFHRTTDNSEASKNHDVKTVSTVEETDTSVFIIVVTVIVLVVVGIVWQLFRSMLLWLSK